MWHWSACGCDSFFARMAFRLEIMKYLSSWIMAVVFHTWFLLLSKGLNIFYFLFKISFLDKERTLNTYQCEVWDLCCWMWPPTPPNPQPGFSLILQCQSTFGFMWDPWKNGFIVSTNRNSWNWSFHPEQSNPVLLFASFHTSLCSGRREPI